MKQTESAIRLCLTSDYALLRQALRQTIEDDQRVRVVLETSRRQCAPQVVRDLHPDVLLCLASVTHISIDRVVRQLGRLQRFTPVLLLNLRSEESLALRVLRAGISGVMAEPSDLNELVMAIHQVQAGQRYLPEPLKARVMERYLTTDPLTSDKSELTHRELEVLRKLASGLTNREISERLYISIKTVDAHRGNLLRKLSLRNNADLTRYAIREGLISLEA